MIDLNDVADILWGIGVAETSPTDTIVHVSKAMRTLPIIILGITMIVLSKTMTNMMVLPVAFAGLVITLLSVMVELFAYLQNGRTASKKLDEAELDRIDRIEEALKKLDLTMTASNEALASKVGAIRRSGGIEEIHRQPPCQDRHARSCRTGCKRGRAERSEGPST